MNTNEERWYFHWVDWMIFALMLLISAGAGLWHYRKTKHANTEDYLLGGKDLKLIPVSASLVARYEQFSKRVKTSVCSLHFLWKEYKFYGKIQNILTLTF